MKVKKYIPLCVKQGIKQFIANGNKYVKEYKKNDRKIIIALAANYGNLGDIAITYAQKNFLEKNFPNYKIIEVPIDKTYENMKSLKKIISKDDIITIIGGGNFGDIYLDIERARQFFIKKFPKNKIICFPQTIDFSQDKKGKRELAKAIKIYGKNKKLVLFARESKSFDFMRAKFKDNDVYLVPDIVLSLNEQYPKENKEYFTICFKDDKENKINNSKKYEVKEMLKKYHKGEVIEKDTHVGNVKIEQENRKKYLHDIWTSFKKSKIVLTDRLHGMIFCVITGTPCIAFPNSNGKIKSTYETWLKDVPYIKMLKEDFQIEELRIQIDNLLNEYDMVNKTINLKDKYEPLIKAIKY